MAKLTLLEAQYLRVQIGLKEPPASTGDRAILRDLSPLGR
jgi:hypothetical protein